MVHEAGIAGAIAVLVGVEQHLDSFAMAGAAQMTFPEGFSLDGLEADGARELPRVGIGGVRVFNSASSALLPQ